jgi:hypothetical protein
MEIPDGCLGKGYAYFTFPWFAAFKITILDCEEERWGNWYVVSFIVSLYDSTFSRKVWRLYGGAKGLVVWY